MSLESGDLQKKITIFLENKETLSIARQREGNDVLFSPSVMSPSISPFSLLHFTFFRILLLHY